MSQPQSVPVCDLIDYKKQNLSKIHSFTDEQRNTFYFYFFKGQRSSYYPLKELKFLNKQFTAHEQQLIDEYRLLKAHCQIG